ncbi:hypothetical protein CRG98_029031 [Punica granatum]|uniref:RRM domain-containing protein n=1 Tax=Punica granatum TaxID=22663 RepID=A0A2I0J2Z0_PUNGR|nr:hypothetical protein CRG98_029031 [Punica granatum]
MTSRLRVTVSPLLTSIAGERGVISLKSKLPLLNRYAANSSCIGGALGGDSSPFEVEGLRQSLHESAGEDDDFSELGPPVKQGAGKRKTLRLKTEKVDFVKHGRKSSAGASSTVNVNPAKKVPSKSGKPFSNGYNKLEEIRSVFRGISNGSKRRGLDDADQPDIEYEKPVRPPAVEEKTVDDSHSSIHTRCSSETATIRISNICAETSDAALHVICSSCGPLLRIIRIGESAADAVFSIKDEADTPRILERLNYTIMDDCNWSAALESEEYAPAATEIKGCFVVEGREWSEHCMIRGNTECY